MAGLLGPLYQEWTEYTGNMWEKACLPEKPMSCLQA